MERETIEREAEGVEAVSPLPPPEISESLERWAGGEGEEVDSATTVSRASVHDEERYRCVVVALGAKGGVLSGPSFNPEDVPRGVSSSGAEALSFSTDDSGDSVKGPDHVASLGLDDLMGLREQYRIPKEFEMRLARDGELVYKTEEGWLALYVDMFEKGNFRLPLHPFFERFLIELQLVPGELGPNSWSLLVAFLVLCNDLGREPTLGLLASMFELKGLSKLGGAEGLVYLTAKRGKKLFLVPDSLHCDRGKFFMCRPQGGWRVPTRWGQRRNVDRFKLWSEPNFATFWAGALDLATSLSGRHLDALAYCTEDKLVAVGIFHTQGMAARKDDLAKILEQAAAEKARQRAAKRDGKRKKGATSSQIPVIDLSEPPRTDISADAEESASRVAETIPEPAPKRVKLVSKGGKGKELAPLQKETPTKPTGLPEHASAGEGEGRQSRRPDQDDPHGDNLPIGMVLRGARPSPPPNQRSAQASLQHEQPLGTQSSRDVQLRIGHYESFKYAAVARAYSTSMFTETDLSRLVNMKERKVDFAEAMEKHLLEGMLIARGWREECEDHKRLKKKYLDEVEARKGAEQRESEAFYTQQKLNEAVEQLKRLLEQKGEQFNQAQERANERSNAVAVAENKLQIAIREQKREREAHEEELRKLREDLEASRLERSKLGKYLETLEAQRQREKEIAVEEAGKAAVEEFKASEEYRADLISQAMPSYELGLKKFRAVVMEKRPDFDMKEFDAHFAFSDDEDNEDHEEDEGVGEEDKVPLEVPTTEVQVAQVAGEGDSFEIVLEKVGFDDLPDLELPLPLPEGLPEEAPPPLPENPTEEAPPPPVENS